MKKRFILKILILVIISSTLIACGGKKVTEAYKEYISQAKVEIVNGDYDKALQFLTLAKDENTNDNVVDELNDQIEMYRKLEVWLWTIEDGKLTDDIYESALEQVEEANKFVKRKFESNLMIDKIQIKIEDLSVKLNFAKENQEKAVEIQKEIDDKMKEYNNILSKIFDDLDNKEFEKAYDKTFELETLLNELRELEATLKSIDDTYEEKNIYLLDSIISNTRKVYNGINKLNLEKENDIQFYDNLLNELNSIVKSQEGGDLFVELLTGNGNDGYHYHAIFKKENGNYIKYYRHVKGIFDSGFSSGEEYRELIDVIDIINGDSTVN